MVQSGIGYNTVLLILSRFTWFLHSWSYSQRYLSFMAFVVVVVVVAAGCQDRLGREIWRNWRPVYPLRVGKPDPIFAPQRRSKLRRSVSAARWVIYCRGGLVPEFRLLRFLGDQILLLWFRSCKLVSCRTFMISWYCNYRMMIRILSDHRRLRQFGFWKSFHFLKTGKCRSHIWFALVLYLLVFVVFWSFAFSIHQFVWLALCALYVEWF